MPSVVNLVKAAHRAVVSLGLLSTDAKNQILENIAQRFSENTELILKANRRDITRAHRNKLSPGLIDRLTLTEERLSAIVKSVRNIIELDDPIGTILESRILPNGLFLKRVRVPLGVIAIIYEARPNVTIDAAVLSIKSGNAVILKGGGDALATNQALVKLIREVLAESCGTQPQAHLRDSVILLSTRDRNATQELLKQRGSIDVVIPRGGKGLINFVREHSKIPVIETGASVVHAYIDEFASLQKAVPIVLNSKLRRISICNTLDTIIVHKKIAERFLTTFWEALPSNPYKADHLEIRADTESFTILKKLKTPANFKITLKKARPEDFFEEHLDYIVCVKTVKNITQALEHISKHSLKHTETIVTENRAAAERFLKTVDAACVYWNASTQFSDGGEFGLGAEIGISTQKLHVRGPFALEGLTSYKWILEGDGQVRT